MDNTEGHIQASQSNTSQLVQWLLHELLHLDPSFLLELLCVPQAKSAAKSALIFLQMYLHSHYTVPKCAKSCILKHIIKIVKVFKINSQAVKL